MASNGTHDTHNPDPPEGEPLNDAETERQRRLDALHGLAEHATQVPRASTPAPAPPRPSLAPPSRRLTQRTRNRWLAAIAAALCVVVIAVVALTRLGQPRAHVSTAQRPTGPTVIRPALDHIGCPQDAAWSPDGSKIAVFGDNCGASDTMLNIYDITSGKLTAQTDLTITAAQALQSFATGNSTHLYAFFHTTLWTRQYLFIGFTVVNLSGANPISIAEGLLGFNADGAAPLRPAMGIVPNRSGPYAYVRWDMNGFTSSYTATIPDVLVGPAPNHTIFSTLPPSLAYQMDALDRPQPLFPLSYRRAPPSDPGGPIGDPAGDSQLTIWQPGTLTYFSVIPGTSTPASMVLFDTSFAAVQPPPFLDASITFEGRLVPPDQPAPDVNALGAAGLLAPWLPIHDSALAYVLDDVEHSAAPGVGPAAVAWRPDGARLAYQPGIAIGGSGNPSAHDVRIYDSLSGQVLATLTPPLPASTSITGTNLLHWSSDGAKLMLLDRIAGEIVVWGKGQLPA